MSLSLLRHTTYADHVQHTSLFSPCGMTQPTQHWMTLHNTKSVYHSLSTTI